MLFALMADGAISTRSKKQLETGEFLRTYSELITDRALGKHNILRVFCMKKPAISNFFLLTSLTSR